MRVLLTGAFGNVGSSTLRELLAQGHTVRCFDIPSKANQRAARRLRGRAEVVWGDLRRPEDVARAVADQEVVIHLAFIIPKLSATGVGVDDRPDWAREINVGGTQNLLEAMKAQPKPPKIIFASSVHVYGRTQDKPPCRTADDPLEATDDYSQHKILCEQMVRNSGLEWAIFRFGVVFPLALKLDPAMFDVPLDTRLEFVHTRDVGLALANAVSCPDIWGRVLLIGGGERCRFYYRDVVRFLLEKMGVGMLPERAFGKTPFCIDWLDTRESQKLLRYQHRSLEDYAREMAALMGPKRYLLRMFRPLVRRMLLKRSPYFSAS
jgi:UDP-glucose 4-epimerase